MQEEELFKMWVASFMIWWKPKVDVKMPIFDPSVPFKILQYLNVCYSAIACSIHIFESCKSIAIVCSCLSTTDFSISILFWISNCHFINLNFMVLGTISYQGIVKSQISRYNILPNKCAAEKKLNKYRKLRLICLEYFSLLVLC